MLKKNIYNIFLVIFRIFKKNPLIFSLTFLFPLVSGLLTFYSYSAQVTLINLVAVESREFTWNQVFAAAIIPVLIYISVYGVQNLFSSITMIIKNKLNANVTMAFQSDIIDVANNIDFERFDNKEFGDKLQRAKGVVGEDLDGITNFLVSSVGTISSLISIIWLSATSGYYLITLIISIMIVSTLTIRLITEVKVRRVGREITFDGRMGDYLSKTLEDYNALREMKTYNSTNYFIELWGNMMSKQHNKRYGARKFEIKIGTIVAFLQTTTIFIVLIFLLNRLDDHNTVTIGTISVLFLALLSCGNKIMSLTWPLSRLYISSSKLYDLNEVLEISHKFSNKVEINKNYQSLIPITFSNVSFKYSISEKYVLSNINMTIKPGEKIAIVGENGAGKSTLIKLILGQYRPSSGFIDWNNCKYPNGKVSVVFQNFIKFELSLRENIILGNVNENIDDERVMEILEKCELMDLFHELGGLDVELGQIYEGGRQLSGGQWQKLAIARALYNDADLIIFDEPTSAIDPISEMKIYQKLIEICQDKTAIFISHRLGWAKSVDRIYVLESGIIAEEGNHEQLIANNGLYSDMFNLQSSWYK
ncbi:ABC transporter ATP-binding protein/permease [Paenibacillus motobuensis]|uniref:ABC transporter ATP-binding protein n=1 Tax=Paenibacillus TaxID=44249 RepID=UPI00203C4185|nr:MULTISPECIES: ABC transporter ATP-binding protein [Paenibacillus]MCM3039000.1 ABC transporter ATP-binding protein/permease [Paenibacillus lutimineralis]MCM3646104.1 ABC transporter ATP-binding protein/permease [Paenibacillus motobuensis]